MALLAVVAYARQHADVLYDPFAAYRGLQVNWPCCSNCVDELATITSLKLCESVLQLMDGECWFDRMLRCTVLPWLYESTDLYMSIVY